MRLPLNNGSRHIAALIGSSGLLVGDKGGAPSAVSDAVLIARLKGVAALPEGIVAGVKTAVAPGGKPVAVRVIGGFTLPPCDCNAKVKLAVCPGLTKQRCSFSCGESEIGDERRSDRDYKDAACNWRVESVSAVACHEAVYPGCQDRSAERCQIRAQCC